MAISAEIEAPEFWQWEYGYNNKLVLNWTIGDATFTKEDDPYRKSFDSLMKWLEDNELKACKYDRQVFIINIPHLQEQHPNFRYPPVIYFSFEIYRNGEWPYGANEELKDNDFQCGFCNHDEKTESSLFCHNCDALFYCTCCGRRRNAAFYDLTGAHTFCSACGVPCQCGRYHGGYMEKCPGCSPVFTCANCAGYSNVEPEPVVEGSEITACEYCRTIYCVSCERFTEEETNSEHICSRCEYLGADGDKEAFDENDAMTATKLALPTIPGREMIRLSGVEIEGGLGKTRFDPTLRISGPNYLARKLYDNQLSRSYQQVGYHHGEGFARVETDASCDWECVIGPVNMASVTDVRKLNNVIKLIKECIKSDLLKLDLRCGTHIHVGAERVSLGQAYNLHLLYTYLEDPLYRLGAAHWPIHRILINDESHSAQRSPKEDSKTKFARTFHGNRYYGLSFNNYFERMLEGCRCGAARYGAFEECTCDLHKCTFEFRLFNATANTIKIHAYLALSQALVAKAIEMPEIKDATLFQEMPFVKSRFRDMPGDKQKEMIDGWDERLRYIANDLPLTADEKKSIYYCIRNSELAKVDGMKELYKGETKLEVSN